MVDRSDDKHNFLSKLKNIVPKLGYEKSTIAVMKVLRNISEISSFGLIPWKSILTTFTYHFIMITSTLVT